MMEHKLCRSVQSAHVVLHDQGVLANAVLGALVRASDEAQLAEQASPQTLIPLHDSSPTLLRFLMSATHIMPWGVYSPVPTV